VLSAIALQEPARLNTQLCCERYSLSLYRFSCINRELLGCTVFRDLSNYRSTASISYELLLAKSGLGVISSLCVTDIDFWRFAQLIATLVRLTKLLYTGPC